jgi:hypothetical protein
MTDDADLHEQAHQRLLALARIRQRDEQRRRAAALLHESGASREYLWEQRPRLIGDALIARPDWSEADAIAWMDSVFTAKPADD